MKSPRIASAVVLLSLTLVSMNGTAAEKSAADKGSAEKAAAEKKSEKKASSELDDALADFRAASKRLEKAVQKAAKDEVPGWTQKVDSGVRSVLKSAGEMLEGAGKTLQSKSSPSPAPTK